MTTVRFSQKEVIKSWVAEKLEKIIAICFGENTSSKALTIADSNKDKWENEITQLESEVCFLNKQTVTYLIPMAGVYQQHLIDTLLQASTVYAPEDAEGIFSEEVKTIEEIKGHVSGIHYNTKKMQEATSKAKEINDAQSKAVIYHHSVKPYLVTLQFHIDQLKGIISK